MNKEQFITILQSCLLKGDEEGLSNIYLNRNISTHLDKLGFQEFRNKDRHGSYFSMGLDIFNEIVSPICPDLSSPSSHISINSIKKSDDKVTISDDELKKSVTIMTIGDECDDTWENTDFSKSGIKEALECKKNE